MNQGPTFPTSGKHKKSGGVENLIDSVCLSPGPLYNQSLGISSQQEISDSLKATMEDSGVSTHVLSWAFRTFTLSLLCVGIVSGAVRKAIHTTDLQSPLSAQTRHSICQHLAFRLHSSNALLVMI